MALRHIPFFSQTLSLTFTTKPKLNNNNKNRFSFFTPSLSSTALMATSHKVLLPIAEGTEPMEAVIIADVLRRAGADVTVASASASLSVLARHDVKIVADALVSDVVGTSFDLVALPVPLSFDVFFERLCSTLIIEFKTFYINRLAISCALNCYLTSWID